jgi:hypothetical protein
MVFPIIPIMAAAAIILGVGALGWYSRLPPTERERADLRANELALELFGIALDKLDKVRFTRIILAVKREITGKADDDPIGA